jgi:hypothetical protein
MNEHKTTKTKTTEEQLEPMLAKSRQASQSLQCCLASKPTIDARHMTRGALSRVPF